MKSRSIWILLRVACHISLCISQYRAQWAHRTNNRPTDRRPSSAITQWIKWFSISGKYCRFELGLESSRVQTQGKMSCEQWNLWKLHNGRHQHLATMSEVTVENGMSKSLSYYYNCEWKLWYYLQLWLAGQYLFDYTQKWLKQITSRMLRDAWKCAVHIF